jgi:sporulation protein YlmC with PRC-barrel domain
VSIDPGQQPVTHVLAPDEQVDWSEALKRAYGFRVIDQDGTGIGEVEDLFIDPSTGRVRFLRLESGGILGFGKVHPHIPVEAVTAIGEAEIVVDLDVDRLLGTLTYLALGQPRFDIPERTPVVTADDREIGRVFEIHPGFLVAEKGIYFPHYFYLPDDAIAIYDGQKVHLKQTKGEVRDLGWDKAPPILALVEKPLLVRDR